MNWMVLGTFTRTPMSVPWRVVGASMLLVLVVLLAVVGMLVIVLRTKNKEP